MQEITKLIILTAILFNNTAYAKKSNDIEIQFEEVEKSIQQDDSAEIIKVIEKELPTGVISVEQATGKLIHNPVLSEIKSKPNKQQFYLPAMIVNNANGVKLVQNAPLSCFIITSHELLDEGYKSFRQHEILRYIREVKDYSPEKIMICEVSTAIRKNWKSKIKFASSPNSFIFEDYISLNGEHFYYYINDSGNFEMYF